MEFDQMKKHYNEFGNWIESIKGMSENQWFTPIGEGKWSVAAVIAHLLFWDQYSLKERFPFFKEGAVLKSFPDFQEVNERAKDYAEQIASKDQVIEELLEARIEFLAFLDHISEEGLAVAFKIGDQPLTIREYVEDFIQHDLHHQKQIDEAVGSIKQK